MGEFRIISGRQCVIVMMASGIAVSIVATLVDFGRHVFAILYGTLTGISYYMLLNFQYQKGLRTSIQQAAMNINNGLISRVCVVVAFVLFGEYGLNIHIIAVLAGLFITLRIVIIWQVISIACDNDQIENMGKESDLWKE
ncbi:MAG: hypothetical protein K0Q77_1103 [Anaerosporomusa subterranea]|jgi:hypothetical protein|nr:hypothetical protein [Anaerosporomusa subterranea]